MYGQSTYLFALLLSVSSSTTLLAAQAPEGSTDIGSGWLLSGDLRAGWLNYDYSNPLGGDPNVNKGHPDSKGFYFVPKVSIVSPTQEGFYAKVTGAGATDFGLNDPNEEDRNFVFGASGSSYAILQEAYIAYDLNGHRGLIGAEEITTPMIDADDWYMLANTFQMAYYTNKTQEDMMFTVGYFYKMAGVWDSGADGAHYHSMSDASFVSTQDKINADDSGVVYGAYQFDNDTHNFQVWNYYATDLYNTLFTQYDFTQKIEDFSYDFGLQFINWKEVGKYADASSVDRIDYSLYSARFDGAFDNGVNFATGVAKYSNGLGQGETLGAWGGYPYFANGMIFHFFEAGSLQNASSYKAQLGYDFLDKFWIGGRYTYWDLDSSHSLSSGGEPQNKMQMYGVRLNYEEKNGIYFTGTFESVDLDEEPRISCLRLIGGYKF